MRNWKFAIVCIAALPVQSFAGIPIVNLKNLNTAKVTSPSAYNMEQLAADPLLIQSLNISDEEKQKLVQQILDRGEANDRDESQDSENSNGLIHNIQWTFPGFGGNSWNTPNTPHQPIQTLPQDDGPEEKVCQPTRVLPKVPVPPYEPDVKFNQADMKNPEDWKVKYFDVVVVINKNSKVQNLRVWRKMNRDHINELPKLVIGKEDDERSGMKISSGREEAEISYCDRKALNLGRSNHEPRKSYFSQTPAGYYTPLMFNIDHVSGDWEGAAMDHAIFFNLERGIATHKVPNGQEPHLGTNVSGACVRMAKKDAQDLFWIVRSTGGPYSSSEFQVVAEHCMKDYSTWAAKVTTCNDLRGKANRDCISGEVSRLKEECFAAHKARPKPSFAQESQLAMAKGLAPYDSAPQIPAFTREGKLVEDYVDEMGVKGLYWRRGLAKTLYIVENRFVEKKVEPKPVKKGAKQLISQSAPAATKPIVLRPVGR